MRTIGSRGRTLRTVSTKPEGATPPTPTLTERRKAATQLDIARAAAELFTEHGPDGTTAEDIALRAGVALRTFYRYFRSKQDAVAPLLAGGGDRWRELLAATATTAGTHADATAAGGAGRAGAASGPGAGLPGALERSIAASLTPADPAAEEGLRWTRGLLRAAAEDPALRAVWYRVNQESEERLREVVAGLAGTGADPLEVRLAAAAATDAIRIALESWAESDAPVRGEGAPAELAVRCLRELMGGMRLLNPDVSEGSATGP
ncbi:TetR/AcrR family transcriptional regulator [Streptomyces sp. NBC_00233]|uniref:TetR/AcrR family transcriptional regulator n=1 Tax=Streptomyces sp. NBC_00233 TaxID=2975686 RepID=UPI002259363A|nr:TetR/AcrR family transcriptional regulator [Streptomyces sp. NBC_00233]MCX5225775.1 TetR/AcrR family transcriptional regulator [Streptomyces sp. NBC_00233]